MHRAFFDGEKDAKNVKSSLFAHACLDSVWERGLLLNGVLLGEENQKDKLNIDMIELEKAEHFNLPPLEWSCPSNESYLRSGA